MAEGVKQRILNVDDTEAERYAVSRILKQAGYEVMEAANGMDALRLAAQRPDLVLLDVNLPDIDGFEVCRRIKADPATASIPVVHLSANYVQGSHLVQGMEGGADGYLTQPVEAPVLVATIRALLRLTAAETSLRESEKRFRSLTEMSSDFYWESDAEHRLAQRSWVDKKLRSVSMFGQGSPIGKRRWELPYLSPDEAGWQAHRALLEARRAFRCFELSRLAADGTERFISISGDPVFDESGTFQGYRGVGTDITERKRLEQALRASAQELRLFADNVPVMTTSFDENMRCRFANKRYAEFYGFTVENIIGKHVREVAGEDGYREVEDHFVQVLQGRPVTYQRTRKLPSGESRYLEVKLLPHIGEQGKVLGCFAVTTDITEYKQTEERIQQVAHHDSLTGLPNRLLFNDRLQQAINLARRDARQFALLYLDLDRFKQVNDSLGHATGDELLQAVASRIRNQVRESDTVARVGGDEFTVILSNITRREEAEIVATKIIAAVAAPFLIGRQQQSVEIGTSIGISIYPSDGQDADTLVNAADTAMYGAKQVGGSFRFGALAG